MKKLAAVAVVLVVVLAGCCSAPRGAVTQVKASHDIIAKKLLEYVDKDPALDAKAKDDWRKLVESDRRNIESLRKALGD